MAEKKRTKGNKMSISVLSKEQAIKVIKAGLYVVVSALIDYLISETQGTQFGTLTPVINIILVTIKQLFTPVKS